MEESRIKVLVVDDEKIIRDFFSRLLSLQGLEVKEAEDGQKAIELSGQEEFDLFFIDVRMPGLNGLETYRRIRQINPKAQVVMMTGYAMEDILEQAQKEGVYGSIHKPFAIDEIKAIVDKVAIDKSKMPSNILVIDDDDAVLNFFSNFLKSKKQKFKIARNKQEALTAIKEDGFDLVFMDLVLKDTDGLSLYKEIKQLQPEVPIVLMTGYPQKAKEFEGVVDISGCLYKPFEIKSIMEYIDKVKAQK